MGLSVVMQFNPGPTRHAKEVIFSPKTSSNNLQHPPIKFNNNEITTFPHQKHFRIALDSNSTSLLM